MRIGYGVWECIVPDIVGPDGMTTPAILEGSVVKVKRVIVIGGLRVLDAMMVFY